MTNIAVIIPYYQKEAGILRRALTSILQQHLPAAIRVDIIVVDDASPVTMKSEIEGLDFSSPFHLNIVEQPNGGVVAARNTGLDNTGSDIDFIAFLDSDDWWEPFHLERGIAALGDNNGDFYFCDYTWLNNGSDSRFRQTGLDQQKGEATSIPSVFRYKDDFPLEILSKWPVQISGVLIRSKILKSVKFDLRLNPFSSSEDQMYFLECARRTGKIYYDCKAGTYKGAGLNIYNSKKGDAAFTIAKMGNLFFHLFVWREMSFLGKNAKRRNAAHILFNVREIICSEFAAFIHNRKFNYREIRAAVKKSSSNRIGI